MKLVAAAERFIVSILEQWDRRVPANSICIIGLALGLLSVAGCYGLRTSQGGGQTSFLAPRGVDVDAVALPDGYRIEAVAEGLTFPTGLTFDNEGRIFVTEAGYAYGAEPGIARLLLIGEDGDRSVVAEGDNPPWNGVIYHDGAFYIAGGHGREGEILRVDAAGELTQVVGGLPSLGDHHTNGPAIGPDGKIYFGQGTATNSGVVGVDNYAFGWLTKQPGFHDVPCADLTLAGLNFSSADPTSVGPPGRVSTGAFLPFGRSSTDGQVVEGRLPCNGAVMRIFPTGDGLELVAWGFRNPFGLAFDANGRLYVTDNGYDDRGSRPAWGTGDFLFLVEEGAWYGWPDFAGGVPLSAFKPPGKNRPSFLLAEHPNRPPLPAALLDVHSSSNGLDFSRSEAFGFVGDAFVAQFGDMAPGVGKVIHPVGFRVVRVDPERGVVHGFAENLRGVGPATHVGGGGLERPVSVRFDPDGSALYVVDFGVMLADSDGSYPQPGTGVLWRITRMQE